MPRTGSTHKRSGSCELKHYVVHSCTIIVHWFSTGAQALTLATFGVGFGPIFLDDVGCNGSESRLTQCSNLGVGVHNCAHTEDAGVNCSGKRSDT